MIHKEKGVEEEIYVILVKLQIWNVAVMKHTWQHVKVDPLAIVFVWTSLLFAFGKLF